MNKYYDYNDILKAFNKIRLKKGDIVYITGHLAYFGILKFNKINNTPELFYKALVSCIGKSGTICFPTHSFSLCTSKKIFDVKNTRSESGTFTDFLRKKKNSIRQIHPFSSTCAIGKYAKYICKNNSQHVYGPFSPFKKMIKLNAKFISLGMNINENCSQVHQAELDMNVPYRYTKEFNQKIKINNKTYKKKFYMFVLHKRFIKIRRNKNKKIIMNFRKKEKIFKHQLGRGNIYTYNLKKFYQHNIELLKKDIFCWLGKRPKYCNDFTK